MILWGGISKDFGAVQIAQAGHYEPKKGLSQGAGQRRGLYGFLAGFGDEIADFVLLASYGGNFIGNGNKAVYTVDIGADHGEPLVPIFKSHDSLMAILILSHEGV